MGSKMANSKRSSATKTASRRKSERKVVIAVAILAIIAIALFALSFHHGRHPAEWTTFTLDMNNSRYQANSTITSSNLSSLSQKWFIPTNAYVTSTPLVMNGTVYFTDWNGYLYSANILDGGINWKLNLGGAISSTPALVNGTLYVGLGPLGQTDVAAVSTSGKMLWDTALNSTMRAIWGSPTVFKGLIYIGVAGAGGVSGQTDNNVSKIGQIYALNSTTGKVEWSFNTMVGNTGGAAVWSSAVTDPELNSIYFGTGNAYANNTNTSYAYSIVSLNATSGRPNWIYSAYNSFVGDLDFGSTPNLFSIKINGTVYKAVGDGSKDGNYYVLDRLNGELLGEFMVGTQGPSEGIVGLSGFIYRKPDEPELFIPSYYNFSGICCGVVEALSPSNGTVYWKFYTRGNIRGSLVIVPGAVLVGDNYGYIYAISISTGKELFETRLHDGIGGGITAAEGYILVPTYAFGPLNQTGLYAFST